MSVNQKHLYIPACKYVCVYVHVCICKFVVAKGVLLKIEKKKVNEHSSAKISEIAWQPPFNCAPKKCRNVKL